MKITHWLRGYDKQTDRLIVEFEIAANHMMRIHDIAPTPLHNPDYIDPQPLHRDQVTRIVNLLKIIVVASRYDFFLEASTSSS